MSNDNNNTSKSSQSDVSPDFDSIRKVNPYGSEYWSARDLMPLLGYNKWQAFEGAIKRAITACEKSGQAVEDHFTQSTRISQAGKGAQREAKDYNLSRYACYLTALNGDPSKLEVAAAQTYFAQAAREHELHQLARQQKQRVELRERVAEGNKSLNQSAMSVGVLSRNFGKFQNAGYQGLYGGMDLADVKDLKGIEPNEDLLDRAGLEELGANALRIGMTDRKLRSGEVVGENAAIRTHHQAGKEIREAIERFGGPMPEDLPAEPSIKPLIDDRQRAKRKTMVQKAQPQLTMFNDAEDTQPTANDELSQVESGKQSLPPDETKKVGKSKPKSR
jgi:DNA-damage-inducible protein D